MHRAWIELQKCTYANGATAGIGSNSINTGCQLAFQVLNWLLPRSLISFSSLVLLGIERDLSCETGCVWLAPHPDVFNRFAMATISQSTWRLLLHISIELINNLTIIAKILAHILNLASGTAHGGPLLTHDRRKRVAAKYCLVGFHTPMESVDMVRRVGCCGILPPTMAVWKWLCAC